jgi:hypothetical protein
MIDEDDFWSNWWNEIWQGKPKYFVHHKIPHDPVSKPGPQRWEASD